ncbi:MAG: serine hydrolase [Lachnospiraceae bacterium]|nr:serine hydrolase [Lachnospiraceae bacterium]
MNRRKITPKRLQEIADGIRERFHIPSMSITACDGGNVYSVNSGLRDMENGLSADEDTLYAIGSCTKSFVAGTICALAGQGALSLDDLVKKYIPEFEMYDPYVSRHLTVRDMLCHRCGLPRHELSWYARLDTLTEADIIRKLQYLPPSQPFRYKWQYSNQMFALAGFLIGRVTGKPWQEAVRECIFAPLGITRAAFSPAEAKALGNCAEPYLYNEKKKAHDHIEHAFIGAMSAAGTIYMSTAELSKWTRTLLGGGSFEGKEVLKPEYAREMVTPQMIRGDDGEPDPLNAVVNNRCYGLGLETEIFEGERLVHHGGHIDGFMADLSFLQDEDFSAAVLTNVGVIRGGLVTRYTIAEEVLGGAHDFPAELDSFYEDAKRKMRSGNRKILRERPKDKPCPVSPEAIEGIYEDGGYGSIRIFRKRGKLFLEMGTAVLNLTHYANQFFYISEPSILEDLMFPMEVLVDIRGSVTAVRAQLGAEKAEEITFRRKESL